VLGVVLGVVPEDPPEPPMFGQLTLEPVWVLGVVEDPPLDGAVVPGDVDGAGLAAETAATPPPTRSRPEITAVMSARRMPLVFTTGSVSGGGVWIGWRGCRGWNIDSIETPWFERSAWSLFGSPHMRLELGLPRDEPVRRMLGEPSERVVRTRQG
jgi:hypothetical protein